MTTCFVLPLIALGLSVLGLGLSVRNLLSIRRRERRLREFFQRNYMAEEIARLPYEVRK